MVEAAHLYEAVLADAGLPLDSMLDLAILYWQATDFGFSATQGLRKEFFQLAGVRYREILGLTLERFPHSTGARFWAKYTAWIDVGAPLDEADCVALLREDPNDLSPVLFLHSQDERFGQEAEALLRECNNRNTFRSRYTASVIEGVKFRATGRK